MSETEAGAQAPVEVIRKTFLIAWANGESSEYVNIIGSNLENGLLFLMKEGGPEYIIGMEFVLSATIWEQEEPVPS